MYGDLECISDRDESSLSEIRRIISRTFSVAVPSCCCTASCSGMREEADSGHRSGEPTGQRWSGVSWEFRELQLQGAFPGT